ncbi:hypothetical protein ACPZ19_11485 [Amycolatopsis lurida]
MDRPATELLGRRGELTLEFFFDPRWQPVLQAVGVRPSTAGVRVRRNELSVRFGPWRVHTPIANIRDVRLTGPFNPIKAIGPRLSLTDRGLTFGTNTAIGVHVRFHQPVRGVDPWGLVKHPALTLTCAEPQILKKLLSSSPP